MAVSLTDNPFDISIRSPMGINSDVLRMNAATVILMSGIHFFDWKSHNFLNTFFPFTM